MNDITIMYISAEHWHKKAGLKKLLVSIDDALSMSYSTHLISARENVRLALIAEDIDYDNKLRVAKGGGND